MGIQGLLPVLRSISRSVHVSSYAGKRVAVDAYGWLHKAAYGCSMELCEGLYTDSFVTFCMRRVELMQRCGVTPVIVFDGGKLPMKGDEDNSRSKQRLEYLERAQAHAQLGNRQAAYECYQKAVDICPAVAKQFIEALKGAGVDFIVAPYEADAQMAYLAINGLVYAVVTEDSDMLTYGCPRVLFKMDKSGDGQEICMTDLAQNRELNFVGFTPQMFLEMCVLAGCDFLKALPGIGVKKAHANMRRLRSFLRVCKCLRFSGITIPLAYEAAFQRAIWTFNHQRVFCPQRRALVHLRPVPEGGLGAAGVAVPEALPNAGESDLAFLGPPIDDSTAQLIADGDLDPITKEPFPEVERPPLRALPTNVPSSLPGSIERTPRPAASQPDYSPCSSSQGTSMQHPHQRSLPAKLQPDANFPDPPALQSSIAANAGMSSTAKKAHAAVLGCHVQPQSSADKGPTGSAQLFSRFQCEARKDIHNATTTSVVRDEPNSPAEPVSPAAEALQPQVAEEKADRQGSFLTAQTPASALSEPLLGHKRSSCLPVMTSLGFGSRHFPRLHSHTTHASSIATSLCPSLLTSDLDDAAANPRSPAHIIFNPASPSCRGLNGASLFLQRPAAIDGILSSPHDNPVRQPLLLRQASVTLYSQGGSDLDELLGCHLQDEEDAFQSCHALGQGVALLSPMCVGDAVLVDADSVMPEITASLDLDQSEDSTHSPDWASRSHMLAQHSSPSIDELCALGLPGTSSAVHDSTKRGRMTEDAYSGCGYSMVTAKIAGVTPTIAQGRQPSQSLPDIDFSDLPPELVPETPASPSPEPLGCRPPPLLLSRSPAFRLSLLQHGAEDIGTARKSPDLAQPAGGAAISSLTKRKPNAPAWRPEGQQWISVEGIGTSVVDCGVHSRPSKVLQLEPNAGALQARQSSEEGGAEDQGNLPSTGDGASNHRPSPGQALHHAHHGPSLVHAAGGHEGSCAPNGARSASVGARRVRTEHEDESTSSADEQDPDPVHSLKHLTAFEREASRSLDRVQADAECNKRAAKDLHLHRNAEVIGALEHPWRDEGHHINIKTRGRSLKTKQAGRTNKALGPMGFAKFASSARQWRSTRS